MSEGNSQDGSKIGSAFGPEKDGVLTIGEFSFDTTRRQLTRDGEVVFIQRRPLELLLYLAEQPGLADWGAAVLLERLRQMHPELSKLSWQEISADPSLVAKVYSGYNGAGGDWEAWKADLIPGRVAAARMNLDQQGKLADD